jgi:hypothetical protein
MRTFTMDLLRLLCLGYIGVMLTCPIFASEQAKESCPHVKGWKPSKEELQQILLDHQQWLEKRYKREDSPEGRANLCNADLSNAELNDANLEAAVLSDANLSSAKLNRASLIQAQLPRVHLSGAELNNANLDFANLNGAILLEAKLNNAGLSMARLDGAYLAGAQMKSADLNGAGLNGATLAFVNLAAAQYMPASPPPNSFVAGIEGLSTVTFLPGRENGLVQLRELLQRAGLRDLERQATFAIESGRTKHAIADWPEDLSSVAEGVFRKVMFEWTTGYGLFPARALLIIVIVWALLVPIYASSIWKEPGKVTNTSGIYRIWPKDRIETREGMQPKLDNPAVVEPLHRRDISTLGWAAYFSLLSTFQIGFREFSVGTWLSRAQPRNFVLESVGWVRTVSGLQSLLSVYLLAMWLLAYFGRPFQ